MSEILQIFLTAVFSFGFSLVKAIDFLWSIPDLLRFVSQYDIKIILDYFLIKVID